MEIKARQVELSLFLSCQLRYIVPRTKYVTLALIGKNGNKHGTKRKKKLANPRRKQLIRIRIRWKSNLETLRLALLTWYVLTKLTLITFRNALIRNLLVVPITRRNTLPKKGKIRKTRSPKKRM